MKPFIFLFGMLLAIINCKAQCAVSGKVTDVETAEPISEVSILVANSTLGTKTDASGNYTLKLGPGNYELITSHVGYQTKTVAVTVTETPPETILNISMAIRSIALKEVKINADSWAHDLERFKMQFVGTTNPKDCEIINPKVLDLDFDHQANRLTASNNDLLEIQNKFLGYKLRFLVKEFWADFNTGKCHYRASVVFEEMHGSKSDEKRWVKNRESTYNGSFTHFLTALGKKQLSKEKFVVYSMTREPNPNWKKDSTTLAKARQNNNKTSQTTFLYVRSPQKNIETLSKNKLTEDDILKPTVKQDVFKLQFPGYIYVIYKGKTVETDFDDLTRQSEASVYQISALSLKDANMPAVFKNDGQLLTHEAVFFEGAWDSRIMDMLPSDYKPN